MIKTGGGTFDPHDKNIYFIAANVETLDLAHTFNKNMLLAVNELSDTLLPKLDSWLDAGNAMFIDSGVFWLTMEHARTHDVSMDIALATPPAELDGFDDLFEKYITIIQRIKDRVWGYIEIDAGGREQKIKTRAKLEGLGLNPIPVYHPFNDGWDYFDYLAERYDRICFGNLVQAPAPVRKKLIATMWQRKQKYPHLWIHLLGVTPSPITYAFPADSMDSSSWIAGARWGRMPQTSMARSVGVLDTKFVYDRDSDKFGPNGHARCRQMAGVTAAILQRNWRNHLKRIKEITGDK